MVWFNSRSLAAIFGMVALCFATTTADAGTVTPWFEASTARPTILAEVTSPSYSELLNILSSPFMHSPKVTSHPPAIALISQCFFLLAMLIAALSIRQPYVAFAALLARSRTRWIIARKPFERWADKWSFRPNRPSSPAASTLSTSDTVKPS